MSDFVHHENVWYVKISYVTADQPDSKPWVTCQALAKVAAKHAISAHQLQSSLATVSLAVDHVFNAPMKPVVPIDVAKLIKPFASDGVTQKGGGACNHPISATTTQNVIDHLQISMIHLCATVCMSQSAIWHRSMMSDKRKGRKCKPRGFPFSAVFPCFPPFFLLFGDLNFFGMITMEP